MRRIVLWLAMIGACVGRSDSQVISGGGSAPDYEIVEKQEENSASLEAMSVIVATDSIKGKDLRRIAEDIKADNADLDAVNVEFYKDAPGQNEGQGQKSVTGAAIILISEEAATQFDQRMSEEFGVEPFTDTQKEKILEDKDGIVVVPFAQIQQKMKQEMEKATDEMEKATDEMELEMDQMEEGMDQDLREFEKEMEQPPKLPKP